MSVRPTQTLEGRLTISNPSDGLVRIEIRDDASHIRFVECKISHADLMKGLMGLAERPVTFKVQSLDKVGKVKHSEPLQVNIPADIGYGDERKVKALAFIEDQLIHIQRNTGKPWECTDKSLSSQNSFVTIDGKHYVNTTISYWE